MPFIDPSKMKTAEPLPGESMISYSYEVDNTTDASGENEPVSVVAVSIDVPFDFDDLNAQSPTGWTAQEWLAGDTPGLAPPSPFLDPDDFDADSDDPLTWRGVLWTTVSSSIPVGGQRSGFSFEIPDIYVPSVDSYAVLGASLSETGLIDARFAIGPAFRPPVPTLSQWGLIALGTLLLAATAFALRRVHGA